MRVNRKSVFVSIAAVGAAGLLAVGAGTSMAATGAPMVPWASSSESYGSGFGGMAANGFGAMMGGVGTGHMYGGASVHAAVASYLGLSQDQLWAQMRSGTSMADIAAAQGKAVSGLEDAITVAMTTILDANTTLTAQQKTDWLSRMKDRIEVMVTSPHAMLGSAAGYGGMNGYQSGPGAADPGTRFNGGMMGSQQGGMWG